MLCLNMGMKVVRVTYFYDTYHVKYIAENFESSSICKKMVTFMLCRHTFFLIMEAYLKAVQGKLESKRCKLYYKISHFYI